jgi:hypothetical protein
MSQQKVRASTSLGLLYALRHRKSRFLKYMIHCHPRAVG